MKNIIKEIEKILLEGKIEEYKPIARLIIESVSGLSKEEIILDNICEDEKNEILEKSKKIAYERINTQKPIQQLLGFGYFMGKKYFVNENVLIPRDETELLVLEAFKRLKNRLLKRLEQNSKDKEINNKKVNILDIGTGSACISIEIAQKLINLNKAKNLYDDFEILAVDNSLEALETALSNIQKFDMIRKIIIRKSDLFSKVRDFEQFDLIVSNPPYIPIIDKEALSKEVLYEPKNALFAPDIEGIDFYKKIIEQAPIHLKKSGILAFECGITTNKTVQAKIIKNLLKKDFEEIEITKDLAGIERTVVAKLKN